MFGTTPVGRTARPTQPARLAFYRARPLALIHGPERSLAALLYTARLWGFYGALSPTEFQPDFDPRLGGYSNLTRAGRGARAGSGWWRGLLLSTSEEIVVMGWLAMLFGWEDLLGLLLGYPKCCVAAFQERWQRAATAKRGDVAAILLEESESPPYDWRVNIFARYLGAALIEHFPCSLLCAASRTLADRYDRLLQAYEPRHREWVRDRLIAPTLYSQKGVAVFREGVISRTADGVDVRYKPSKLQVTAETSRFAGKLRLGSTIYASSDGRQIRTPETRLDGRLLWFSDGAQQSH
jgi:hypothetical protein